MIRTLKGAGGCDRVIASRSVVFPCTDDDSTLGRCVMIVDETEFRAEETLRQIVRENVIGRNTYKDLGNNIYLVKPVSDDCLVSVSLQIDGKESRVYFAEYSPIHLNHRGRFTADGFACGIHDGDVWFKTVEGCASNPFIVTRSYHMDCQPSHNVSRPSITAEQRAMFELGLPLAFGRSKRGKEDEEPSRHTKKMRAVEGSYRSSDEVSGCFDSKSRKRNSRPEKSSFADEGTGSAKRKPLSVGAFGLVAEAECISMGKCYLTGKKLEKIMKESFYHKKSPVSTFAKNWKGICNDDDRATKQWAKRYRLFRRYDEGIRMNETAWYSVTPEAIAEHVASRICLRAKRKINFSVAAFCGAGGDVIQLALKSHSVLGVDNDYATIELAKHNATIYGVDHKIDFVLADMNTFLPRFAPDSVLFDPPWGGVGYMAKNAFDLSDLDVDFRKIFRAWQKITPNIAVKVPRNVKIDQLSALGQAELEQNLLNNEIKTITAYYGELICK